MEVDSSNIISTSVNQALREMTTAYLNQHPSLSLNSLAIRSGVPATTMRRLMQEQNRTELAPHSVLSLVSYILKEKRISKLLQLLNGPIADLLKKCFDQFIFDETKSEHKIDSQLNEILRDKTSYLVYKLAANHCGVSFDELKNSLGLVGLKKCHELLSQSWLMIDQDGKIHAKEKNFTLDLVTAHQHTHTLIDQYRPSEVKSGINLFYSLSEAMTSEGIQQIKKIEKEAIKKIYDVMTNQNFQGDIPYFSIVLSEAIGFYNSSQNEEINIPGVQ